MTPHRVKTCRLKFIFNIIQVVLDGNKYNTDFIHHTDNRIDPLNFNLKVDLNVVMRHMTIHSTTLHTPHHQLPCLLF
jgi:hypothetical protein